MSTVMLAARSARDAFSPVIPIGRVPGSTDDTLERNR